MGVLWSSVERMIILTLHFWEIQGWQVNKPIQPKVTVYPRSHSFYLGMCLGTSGLCPCLCGCVCVHTVSVAWWRAWRGATRHHNLSSLHISDILTRTDTSTDVLSSSSYWNSSLVFVRVNPSIAPYLETCMERGLMMTNGRIVRSVVGYRIDLFFKVL